VILSKSYPRFIPLPRPKTENQNAVSGSGEINFGELHPCWKRKITLKIPDQFKLPQYQNKK